MANPDHLAQLKKGPDAWNAWRLAHPEVRPDLAEVDLHEAQLRGLDLKGARLNDARLSGADLLGADLQEAQLSGADLSGAFLSGADLSGSDLRGADLSGAFLSDADLQRAILRRAVLHLAELSDANLYQADLNGAVLTEAFALDADLQAADLQEARLAKARLRGSSLSGANLEAADLTGADLRETNLHNACLQDADLSTADLRQAVGVCFDATLVRYTRFAPDADDRWTLLRRAYSLPKLFLLLSPLLLLPGLLPDLRQTGLPAASVPLALLLLPLGLYAALRVFLTLKIDNLRDQESRSGHTPPLAGAYGYDRLYRLHRSIARLAWVAGPALLGLCWLGLGAGT